MELDSSKHMLSTLSAPESHLEVTHDVLTCNHMREPIAGKGNH